MLSGQKKPADGTQWSFLRLSSPCMFRRQFSRASCIYLCASAGSEFLFPTFLQDLALPDVVLNFGFDYQTKVIMIICAKEVLCHPHKHKLIFLC